MQNVEKLIISNKLINENETIGVACSGGRDSMALLHFLNSIKEKFKFNIVCINIDHNLRENSKSESMFVLRYCEKQGIKVCSYKVNVQAIVKKQNVTLEQGARIARYRIFDSLVKNKIVDKIALAHHQQDQTETILLNIIRGAGLSGASGMDIIRDGVYIRPFLKTPRTNIQAYIVKNDIPYVDDESNAKNEFNRNYIRNMIMPLIRSRWQNADSNICTFGETCKSDETYFKDQIDKSAIVIKDNIGKIKMTELLKPIAIVNRIIMYTFKQIGVNADIEKKHLYLIVELGLSGKNGGKLDLPNNVTVCKEYDYLTLINNDIKPKQECYELKKGATEIKNFGMIEMTMTRKFELGEYNHIVDYNKIPKDSIWRFRLDGDSFTKFGGGTKSLNDYFIDKKIPKRLRDLTPVLAKGNEIFIVAGIEISDKVKLDDKTITAWGVNVIKFFN